MDNPEYIGPEDIIYHVDEDKGIYSGGFSVKSILLKNHMSPIVTANAEIVGGGGDRKPQTITNVADIFNDLVIPNWALSYSPRILPMMGGDGGEHHVEKVSETITDELYNKLLDLLQYDEGDTVDVAEEVAEDVFEGAAGGAAAAAATKRRRDRHANNKTRRRSGLTNRR